MTTIQPKNLQAAIRSASKDKIVTEQEAKKFSQAVVKDLMATSNPKETLALAAQNLRAFLEPFRGGRLPDNGLRAEQRAQYSAADLANALENAGGQLETVKGGTFTLALGLSTEDGKLQPFEAARLQKVAEQMVASSSDPAATAATLRDILVALDGQLETARAFGQGPTRDQVMGKAASRRMDSVSRFLGGVIAEHLQAPAAGRVDADSDFARGIKEMLQGGGGFRMELLMLPTLVDSELGKFDSTGFSGPAKLKLDAQAEARGKQLLKYVDAQSGDTEDIKERLYRMVTGHFCPPEMQGQLEAQLKDADTTELRDAVERMASQAKELEGTRSFSVRRERAALEEGVSILRAELARRDTASGLSSLDSPARRKAVTEFIAADSNLAQVLSSGGKVDADKMKFFTWDEAKRAVASDFGANVDLDTVLQNMAGAGNMLRADAREGFAFVRVPLTVPGETEPFPLTLALKKDGADWKPVRTADGAIPF